MPQLVLATRNRNKVREFAELWGAEFAVRALSDYPDFREVPETGATFEENAMVKAMTASRQIEGLILADDSGLEVDALEGKPGIRSARFAGEGANDQANVAKLLTELATVPAGPSRSGRFQCVLALARDGKLLATCKGTVEGSIALEPAGTSGFGYDPVFIPEGFDDTFAQLPSATKNKISHRGRAIEALREILLELDHRA